MAIESPLVSVVMPVFNAEKYLKEAIDSVLNQTHNDWELIVVNDGSTDESQNILESYQDVRINVLNQKNKGVSFARNLALEHCSGKYLCFLDSDDLLPESSLEKRISILENNSDIRFLDGSVELFSDKESIIKKHTFNGNPFEALLNLNEECFNNLTWMIRMMPNESYFFEEGLTHGEDLLFLISISKTGKYEAIENVVYKYRQHNSSAMKNIDALALGYNKIADILSEMSNVSAMQGANFRRRTKKIIIKSFLKSGNILKGISYIFK